MLRLGLWEEKTYSALIVYFIYRLRRDRPLWLLGRDFRKNGIYFLHKFPRRGLRFLAACLRLFRCEFALCSAVSAPFLPSCVPPACRKHSEEVPCPLPLNNGWNRPRA